MLDAVTIALLRRIRKQNSNDVAQSSKIIEQLSSSEVWEINHSMNKYPSVTVIDSGNNVVYGDVAYIDANNIKITFCAPFSGKVILN